MSVKRHADLAELGRKVEEVAIAPVPADEAEILVEHADALRHLVERDLHEVARVLDRFRRVVEQLHGGLGRRIAAA